MNSPPSLVYADEQPPSTGERRPALQTLTLCSPTEVGACLGLVHRCESICCAAAANPDVSPHRRAATRTAASRRTCARSTRAYSCPPSRPARTLSSPWPSSRRLRRSSRSPRTAARATTSSSAFRGEEHGSCDVEPRAHMTFTLGVLPGRSLRRIQGPLYTLSR